MTANKPCIKRTQWFSGDTVPYHRGVYERYYDGFILLSHWDGLQWGFTAQQSSAWPAKYKIQDATEYRYPASGDQDCPWRGLIDSY